MLPPAYKPRRCRPALVPVLIAPLLLALVAFNAFTVASARARQPHEQPRRQHEPAVPARSMPATRSPPAVQMPAPAAPAPAPAAPVPAAQSGPPPPPAERIHIGVSTDDKQDAALVALINSTLTHNPGADIAFHVLAPQQAHGRLSHLDELFPAATFTLATLAPSGAEAKIRSRLRALRGREACDGCGGSEDADRSPDDESEYQRWAVAYLPILFPRQRRLLWLHTDALVQACLHARLHACLHPASTLRRCRQRICAAAPPPRLPAPMLQADLTPLWRTPLAGKPVAAVEDCSRPLEGLVNQSLLVQLAAPSQALDIL